MPGIASSSEARKSTATLDVDFPPDSAGRIGRAQLLPPGAPKETRQATARSIARSPTRSRALEVGVPEFMFAKGLAGYRVDRLDVALVIMRGEASGVLKPKFQLIEAMALNRSGHREEARKTPDSAINGCDLEGREGR